MDCSPPGSSVHGILQERILEWVAIPFSRGSSQARDWTHISCIAGRFFTIWATRESHHHHIIDALKFILSNDVILRGFMLLCLLYVLSPGRLKPWGLTSFWCSWLSKNTPWVTFYCITMGNSYQLFIYHSVMLSLFLNFGVACLLSPFYTLLSLVQ